MNRGKPASPASERPSLPGEIGDALRRFRARVRTVAAMRGAGITIALATTLLGAALLLDRLVLLPPAARLAMSLCVLAVAALSALLAIVLPLLRPITDRRAARGVEAAAPSLEEGLLSAVEISEDGLPPGGSGRLADAAARSAAARVSGLDPRLLVEPRSARLAGVAAVAGLLALLAFAAADLRAFVLLADRFFHPGMDLPRPSRVTLEVTPGNGTAGVDDDVPVEVTAIRGSPPAAAVRWRVPGGEWRTAAMEARPDSGPPAFRHEFRRVRQAFEYGVLAGDASTPVFRIEVRERPRPVTFRVTCRFPAYTGRPPQASVSPRGDLRAVAGSAADLEVVCSGPPARARLSLQGSEAAVPLAIEPGPGGAAIVRGRIEIGRSGAYNLHLEDASGISNRGGESYSIAAEADRPPRVRVLSPKTTEVMVEDAERLEVRYQVQDDFGLESLEIVAGEEDGPGSAERRFSLPVDRGAERTVAAGSYRWDLASLGLRPGESIPFRLIAKDGLGQAGTSPEMVIRMAILPDPPEGSGWIAGLRELGRGLDRVRAEWASVLGPERPASFAADPARAERLARSGEDLLLALARLRALGDVAAALGRSIPIPSVNRSALPRLGLAFRRLADEEGKTLWTETVAASGRIREASGAGAGAGPGLDGKAAEARVSAAALLAALDAGSAKLDRLAADFTAIHRAERMEAALERLRGLVLAEEDLAARAGEAAGSIAGTVSPVGGATAATWRAIARLGRALHVGGTALAADLAGAASLGSGDGALDALGKAYLEGIVPLIEAAASALEDGPGPGAAAVEAAARGLRGLETRFVLEMERLREAAREARAALAGPRGIAARLASLGAAEGEAAGSLERDGSAALDGIAAGDRGRRSEIIALLSDLEAEAEAGEMARPADFESAGDVVAARDLFRGLAEALAVAERRTDEIRLAAAGAGRGGTPAADETTALAADRRRLAESIAGLARAWAGIEPATRLGRAARALDAIAEAQDAVAWGLRSARKEHARTLRSRAGIEEELRMALDEVPADIEAVRPIFPAGSPAAASIAAALGSVHSASKAAGDAAASCLALDPPKALGAALDASRAAGEASRRIDGARAALPDLAGARAWIVRQAGSLAERVEKLASSERVHVEVLERLLVELGTAAAAGGTEAAVAVAPQQPERLSAVALDGDLLREEAVRLGSAASREAARAGSGARGRRRETGAPAAAAARTLDAAAGRILEVARGEMLGATRAVEAAARSVLVAEQRALLEGAAGDERTAAAALSDVARTLRILDRIESVEMSRAELETLLGPPPAKADPPSAGKVLEEARALLAGVARAAAVLATRLPEGVLKADLLDRLRIAAEKFREAIDRATAGDAPGGALSLEEGRAALGEAIALARRMRGEADEALAAAEGSGRQGEVKKPESREIEEVRAELARIRSLLDRQAGIEAEIEDLLRGPGEPGAAEKMRELSRLQRELSEEMGEGLLSTEALVRLVADLLAAGGDARRIAGEERGLAREAADSPGDGAPPPLRARQEALVGDAEGMARKLGSAGSDLSVRIPAVARPFRDAEARAGSALDLMRGALAAIDAGRGRAAGEELRKAAGELEVLADLLVVARTKALEEIAAREEERSSLDIDRLSMEASIEDLRGAARELEGGRLESALSLGRSAGRSLASAAEALRSRLDRLRLDPGADLLLAGVLDDAARIPGPSWEVSGRGDEEVAPAAGEGSPGERAVEVPDAVPEEYRELVRIYLRALAERRAEGR